MNIQYVIYDTFQGKPFFTNNKSLAQDLSKSEDYFVVDVINGLWLDVRGRNEPLKEET